MPKGIITKEKVVSDMQKVAVVSKSNGTSLQQACELLMIKLSAKADLTWVDAVEQADFVVFLAIQPGIGKEGYCISKLSETSAEILGNDTLGLYYGIGRFLRLICQQKDGIQFGTVENEISVPKKQIRGMYFATHFHNFYEDAPISQVYELIQDNLLWGCNVIAVWFDMAHYEGISDPKAVKMIARLKDILHYVKRLGMGVLLCTLANEHYANSPAHLRANYKSEGTKYHHDINAHYHVELCPSKPGATEELLRVRAEVLQQFLDVEIDYIWIWPYDQGGCTCDNCFPWGANGYLKIAKELSIFIKQYLPKVKILLSTWYFDHFCDGEWDGFYKALEKDNSWCDYVVAEFAPNDVPKQASLGKTPGDLPFLGFPEISMCRSVPWGGFGAKAMPNIIKGKYDLINKLSDGGFPYSEGMYEDINKAICLQLYWGKTDVRSIVLEYCASNFSPEYAKEITDAIFMFEKTNHRMRYNAEGKPDQYPDPNVKTEKLPTFVFDDPTYVVPAYKIISEVNQKLPERIRCTPRWRVVYLRAVIDYELVQNGGQLTDQTDIYFNELTEIYSAQNGDYVITPPTRKAVLTYRGIGSF